MRLTDRQIEIIGRAIPAVHAAAQNRDPQVHAVGIGRRRVGRMFTEDHCIVFFVVDEVAPPTKIDIGESAPFVVDGVSLEVETDVVVAPMAVFAACSGVPMDGGDCVATVGTGTSGTVGIAIVHPDKRSHYLVSAAHVLTGFGTKAIGSSVIHPADDASAKVGELSHLGPDWPAQGGTMDADVSLASVLRANDISYEIPGIGTIAGTAEPKEREAVSVRGAVTNAVVEVEIDYIKCTATVLHERQEYVFSNVFMTKKISRGGDSGAVAVAKEGDEPGKVVGLLFAHSTTPRQQTENVSQHTLFANVVDCIELLEIADWHWGRPPA